MRPAWRSSLSARLLPRPSHSAALSSTKASRHSCRSVNLASTAEFRGWFDCSQRSLQITPHGGSDQGARHGRTRLTKGGASSHLGWAATPWFNTVPRERAVRAIRVPQPLQPQRTVAAWSPVGHLRVSNPAIYGLSRIELGRLLRPVNPILNG